MRIPSLYTRRHRRAPSIFLGAPPLPGAALLPAGKREVLAFSDQGCVLVQSWCIVIIHQHHHQHRASGQDKGQWWSRPWAVVLGPPSSRAEYPTPARLYPRRARRLGPTLHAFPRHARPSTGRRAAHVRAPCMFTTRCHAARHKWIAMYKRTRVPQGAYAGAPSWRRVTSHAPPRCARSCAALCRRWCRCTHHVVCASFHPSARAS